jgi:phospholipase/carboxylesterase
MTLQTGLRHPEKLAGMLCLSGYLPLALNVQAERTQESMSTPIFMAHGRQDPVVPFIRAEQSRDALKQLGYNVEWHEYMMQHSLCLDEVRDINAWLRKVLA